MYTGQAKALGAKKKKMYFSDEVFISPQFNIFPYMSWKNDGCVVNTS